MTTWPTAEFLYEQFLARLKGVTTPLDGRTIIVTGANTGLGLQTAIHLARLAPGGRIILACRDLEKGNKARDTVLAAKGVQGPVDAGLQVECYELDLASFASVKAFAARAEEELSRLDVLVENAGVMFETWSTTQDGWETTLQVNVLATGLLGLLLIPLLKRTASLPAPDGSSTPFKPHLTIVGSNMHKFVSFNEAKMDGPILLNMNEETTFKANAADRYPVTKLMNTYLALGFAALAGSDVIVNCVNPGLCVSEFKRGMKGFLPYFLNAISYTSEQGALNIAWAATEDTSSVPGAYVSVTAIKETSAFTHSEEGKVVETKCFDECMKVWGEVATEQVHAALEACAP